MQRIRPQTPRSACLWHKDLCQAVAFTAQTRRAFFHKQHLLACLGQRAAQRTAAHASADHDGIPVRVKDRCHPSEAPFMETAGCSGAKTGRKTSRMRIAALLVR